MSYKRNFKSKISKHTHTPLNLVCIELKLGVKCEGTTTCTHPCSQLFFRKWILGDALFPVSSGSCQSVNAHDRFCQSLLISRVKCFMRPNIATQIFKSLPHFTTLTAVSYKGPQINIDRNWIHPEG